MAPLASTAAYSFHDNDLLMAVRAGDPRAFGALHAQYAPALVSLAARRIDDVSAAEDLVQDVFLNVWTNRQELALRASPGTYLYRAVQNRVSNYHRRRKIERAAQELVAQDVDVTEALFDSHAEVDARLDERWMTTTMEMAIASLPPKARETYRLVRQEKRSYADAARVLGISVKTVEMHMTRALRHLRSRMSIAA